MPDFKSEWHKQFPKIDDYLNLGNFTDEMEAVLNTSQPIAPAQTLNETDPAEKPSNVGEWELLGLRAFKTTNITKQVFNILQESPKDKTLITSDFDEEMRAHLPYSYAKSVAKNKGRIDDNGKSEVKEWVSTQMPKEPNDNHKGFKKGSAAAWLKQIHGADHVHVLERVLKKSDIVVRPSISAYVNTTQNLQPDQEVLDSLPNEEFFTTIRNSHNIG